MDNILRQQTSAIAEFSGRGQFVSTCQAGMTLRTRSLPSGEVLWRRRTPHPATFFAFRALKHIQRQGYACPTVSLAALPDTAIRSGAAAGAASAPSSSAGSGPQAASAHAEVSGPAVAAPTIVGVTMDSDECGTDGAGHGMIGRVYSSFEGFGTLESTSTLELDSDDPEMCTLVADDSGDVQVVCESDPAHPLSLAEAAVYRPPLPPTILQDIEAKLEADLVTIAVTILFAVGFISLEFGINDLIEHYFGDSLLSDVVCVGVGLVVVFWVRISKFRLMRFDRWR